MRREALDVDHALKKVGMFNRGLKLDSLKSGNQSVPLIEKAKITIPDRRPTNIGYFPA